ncbi:MAG: antibiotic biosynthesis monooxygenase [Ignavibacteriales bacterium]|nr:antibiotic biosynthesis monooxygenase [Ignavibacteriota bacterium]MCB9250629.1 antibiotic biosynthesis monooxygenase [Ignavibacteriales bacterium]
MVEVAFTYDFHPDMDEEAYKRVARKATALMVSAEGFIEIKANRNMLGSPNVRRSSVWDSMENWAKLAETPEFQKVTQEFRKYVTNTNVNIWGASPYMPEPIKP